LAAAAYHYQADTLSGEERERLILEHLPQVRLVARKIHERLPESICFEDLLSAGVIGLIQAIDNYDPRHNVKLKTYAEFRIRGSILDNLRETDWAPRLKRKQAREFEAAIARVEQRLGRAPEESEIAGEVNLTVEEYRQKLTEMEALNIGTGIRPRRERNAGDTQIRGFGGGRLAGDDAGARGTGTADRVVHQPYPES